MYPASIFLNYFRFLWNSLLMKMEWNNQSGKKSEKEALGSRKVNPKGWISSCVMGFHHIFKCLSVCTPSSKKYNESNTRTKVNKCMWTRNSDQNMWPKLSLLFTSSRMHIAALWSHLCQRKQTQRTTVSYTSWLSLRPFNAPSSPPCQPFTV